jgi:penicillin-binding protein 2
MRRFKPGITFSDFVITGRSNKSPRVTPISQDQVFGRWLWVISTIALIVLLGRLINLQIFSGGKYRILADENRIRTLTIAAPRGRILDEKSQILEDTPANSSLLGFVGEINAQEVGLLSANNKYQIKDLIGRAGLQKQYEDLLKGTNGGRIVEVDTNGTIERDLGEKPSQPGKDLPTNIRSDLQKIAHEGLVGKNGAVVVSEPATGKVLALVSVPALFNRSLGGIYPPGSTFKMVTTVAALSEKKVSKFFTVDDVGTLIVSGFKYSNWFFTQYGKTEGVVGFEKALARSNDIFFYKLGGEVGAELIAKWAKILGYGQTAGLDMPGEVAGLVPTPAWKEKFKGEKWFLGNTYHMAIGQGDVLATPVQVNLMTNILATNKRCQLHIAQFPISNSQFSINDSMTKCSNVQIDQEILDIIKRGMVGACQDGGTAYPFFEWTGPEVACKTGTAEYINDKGKYGTHAWFTVFAPSDNPQISVTVLVEGGGEGSRVAAPIARKILSAYFNLEDKYNYGAITGQGE